MTVSMYSFSAPIFLHGLRGLNRYLQLAIDYANEPGHDQKELFDARLAPDMLPLSGQIQRASDTSKAAIGRLTELQAPSFPDDESTLGELQERVGKTIAFLDTVTPEAMLGCEEREVKLPFLDSPLTGYAFLAHFAIPNFYFHCTTVHAIFRNRGLLVGKRDFLGLDADTKLERVR